MPLLTPIVANMEVEGPVGSDLSFNKKSEVSLIYDLQVLVQYFKESTYSDRFAEMQLKPDTIGLSGENFDEEWKICIREEWNCFDRNL